jgi:hypothetical protein
VHLQQNGLVERLNCTLTENVRAMLAAASLPKKWWVETFTSTKLYNLCHNTCDYCAFHDPSGLCLELLFWTWWLSDLLHLARAGFSCGRV